MKAYQVYNGNGGSTAFVVLDVVEKALRASDSARTPTLKSHAYSPAPNWEGERSHGLPDRHRVEFGVPPALSLSSLATTSSSPKPLQSLGPPFVLSSSEPLCCGRQKAIKISSNHSGSWTKDVMAKIQADTDIQTNLGEANTTTLPTPPNLAVGAGSPLAPIQGGIAAATVS